MKTKTIVFDLFNTLVYIQKNNRFFIEIYKASENGFELSISEYLNLIMTNPIDRVIVLLGDKFKVLFEQKMDLLKEEIDSIIAFEETVEVLENLSKKFDLYLISNLASPYKAVLKDLNLEQYFIKTIFSCDTGYQKPEIKIFLEVEKDSGLEKGEILMVGDSLKADIKGSNMIGWNSLRICRNKDRLKNFEINNLKEIFQYIRHYQD
ncbi:HAD family hydrolase [Aureibacter tunicatorum]|uniref:Hydrolase of the HAD superfamily n=1 Tax=Aureibacter tunicatorum TaxID=866807 RepID=A0AAE4BSF0_9BACT|nr:HAD family hydrolase [Aureibacter tunicatorum]MDR6241179.1 putative hydrolase of the HAD superfamily [Aureibacter tunicatorum]BDD03954.1 hypothetical protein AUTU_14370 [Aureibacter tunicatorum]